ncbi:unnamed protein product [Caenorhabditis auriculariae]|uniref:Uncharacterized protein n=1 Tax=Caenorhabditis auriculariae TaxID=2777116 RepID=A0A8S1HG51_9PELO|nr:unnamed protein product [Caenorhabditis auriculariae]
MASIRVILPEVSVILKEQPHQNLPVFIFYGNLLFEITQNDFWSVKRRLLQTVPRRRPSGRSLHCRLEARPGRSSKPRLLIAPSLCDYRRCTCKKSSSFCKPLLQRPRIDLTSTAAEVLFVQRKHICDSDSDCTSVYPKKSLTCFYLTDFEIAPERQEMHTGASLADSRFLFLSSRLLPRL